MRDVFITGACAFLLAFALIMTPGCSHSNRDAITIAVAANMQYAADTLVAAYRKQHGFACETVVGSSGKLTAQITEGAPFDVFLSADMKYPEFLHKKGLTAGRATVYAHGRLVLWTVDESTTPSIDLLTSPRIRHIALANPKTAPYGAAAVSVLRHYDLLDKVEDKLVYGESIAQTNQFILTGAADIGFTSKSVVLSGAVGQKGSWQEVNDRAYAPIAQGIVILKGQKDQERKAMKFRDFLLSEKGKSILRAYGYATE